MWAGSYHELGRTLCERAGVAWNEPPDDLSGETREFWNETSRLLLLDVDGSEWAMKLRNLYVAASRRRGVAASRARLRLHVFAKNGVELPGRG